MSYPIAIYPAKVFASGQISFPAKVRDYLGVTKDDELRFEIESDGTVTISKEKTIEEEIDAIWGNMDPKVRHEARKRTKAFYQKYPDMQDRLEAEKNWSDTPEGKKYLEEQYGV